MTVMVPQIPQHNFVPNEGILIPSPARLRFYIEIYGRPQMVHFHEPTIECNERCYGVILP